MTETITADICLNAFTVAATAVAEAMSKSKKPRRKVVDATTLEPMAHDHKNTTQSTEPDLPELVSLADVRTDGGTQARMTINETVVKDYADALEAGVKLPPVVLYYDESADVHWLADGFHRFEAHRMIGRVAISAFVTDGTQRDAKLHAAGANATHGLPRTNEDKRCAVTMLLQDQEWANWSDGHIAKICCVSQPFVGKLRASLKTVMSEAPVERTYTTKHGTTATMQTTNVGKAKLGPAAKPSKSTEFDKPADTDPENIASPCLPFKQGLVTVSSMDELLAESAALREENANLKAALAETLAENEDMGRVFDADDQVKAALAEAARHNALAENAERTLAARSHEFNERARNVVYWKNRAEKAEKLLSEAEATNDQGALRAENARLRADIGDLHAQLGERNAQLEARTSENETLAAQLGDLDMMFQEALDCHDEMREILEANVPLHETPRVLQQALELVLTLESRVAEAARCHADAHCEQDGVTQSPKMKLSCTASTSPG